MIFILPHFYKSVSNIERASTLNGLALSISLVIDILEFVNLFDCSIYNLNHTKNV